MKPFRMIRIPYVCLLFAGVIGYFYADSLKWLFDQWMTDKLYSHGFIVPLISLYLVWLKRPQFTFLKIKPGFLIGGILFFLSGFLLLIGRVGAIVQLEALSLLLMLPALVIFVLGTRWFACLWVPLAYLIFMVPVIDPFVEKIQFPFQLISAKIAAFALRLFGFTLHLDGVYIYFTNITIEVAKECSGIHFLFSVFAIAVPLVYITQKTWFKAIMVLFCGFLSVILINSIRVALASYMGHRYGAEILHGPGHIFRGWFVAQAGWVIIFLINWIVCKFPSRSEYRIYEHWKTNRPQRQPVQANKKSPLVAAGVAIVILILFAAYLNMYAIPHPTSLKKDLADFPLKIDGYSGKDSDWLDDDALFTHFDATIERRYTGQDHQTIATFVGYLEKQNQSKRLISYRDDRLFTESTVRRTGITNSGPERVNHAQLMLNGIQHEIVFWYRFPDGNLSERKRVKIKTITDALFHRRNAGGVIIVAIPAKTPKIDNAVSGELIDFIKIISPVIDGYLP